MALSAMVTTELPAKRASSEQAQRLNVLFALRARYVRVLLRQKIAVQTSSAPKARLICAIHAQPVPLVQEERIEHLLLYRSALLARPPKVALVDVKTPVPVSSCCVLMRPLLTAHPVSLLTELANRFASLLRMELKPQLVALARAQRLALPVRNTVSLAAQAARIATV